MLCHAVSRLLLVGSRREYQDEKDVLFDNHRPNCKYLTLVLSGEVTVIRTLDDVEIGRGKCSVGCYFGAFESMHHPRGIPESERETPVKEGGNGVNNCVIVADSKCPFSFAYDKRD